jgi:beta-aspartyl-peptidase (threonine type)
VSATGQGEYFIRAAAARTVAALMEFTGAGLFDAICDVVHSRLKALGGTGGLIGMDRRGTLCAIGNVPGLLYAGCTSRSALMTSFDTDSDG